jgi:hypothetical protein
MHGLPRANRGYVNWRAAGQVVTPDYPARLSLGRGGQDGRDT